MVRIRFFATLAAILVVAAAHADYVVTPLAGGVSAVDLQWGDSLTIDLVLSSDAGDVHDSAIVQLIFTAPGLVYESYAWAAPYTSAPPLDDSTPILADLPAVLDVDSFYDPVSPTLVDLELSNVLIGATFGSGTLVSLDFTVPADFGFEGTLYVAATPDTLAHGFDEIPTAAGTPLTLNIIPEPATLLALLAGVFLSRRR